MLPVKANDAVASSWLKWPAAWMPASTTRNDEMMTAASRILLRARRNAGILSANATEELERRRGSRIWIASGLTHGRFKLADICTARTGLSKRRVQAKHRSKDKTRCCPAVSEFTMKLVHSRSPYPTQVTAGFGRDKPRHASTGPNHARHKYQ